jgi:hypothetical protein
LVDAADDVPWTIPTPFEHDVRRPPPEAVETEDEPEVEPARSSLLAGAVVDAAWQVVLGVGVVGSIAAALLLLSLVSLRARHALQRSANWLQAEHQRDLSPCCTGHEDRTLEQGRRATRRTRGCFFRLIAAPGAECRERFASYS